MLMIRRVGGPTPTETGEYRVWLSDQLPAKCRRRFLKLNTGEGGSPTSDLSG